jgi:3-oxoacyl-[acyl-carrier protein] reductase
MDLDLQGKSVAVTGAAGGIGGAIVRLFAGLGADVHATDRSAEALAAIGAQPNVTTHVTDLTDRAAAAAWIANVERATGRPVDVLVNNAGGSLGQVPHAIETVSDAEWDSIMAINLDAVFALCRAVVPGMKRAGAGRIIMVSSRAGSNASLHGIQAYTAAKHAVNGLTRQLAADLGQHGITVNGVAPGLVRTNSARDRQWASYGEAGQQAMLGRIGLRRLGTSDDIAKVVAFLASDLASFVTGVVIPVDGGHN